MIKYRLTCDQDCEFEAWFRCSESYEVQVAMGHVECPHCGSSDIKKSIMAPTIARRSDGERQGSALAGSDMAAATEAEITDVLRRFRAEVEARADYVGDAFASEVRDMHFDDKPKRDVWGEATSDEIRELLEDEIALTPVPRLPEDSD